MSSNSRLYDKTVLKSPYKKTIELKSKTYRGFSTVSSSNQTFSLYDLALIKQDIINHFHVRQGERLENPTFGTIIWDFLFEPMTNEIKNLLIKNVEQIINYDPRVQVTEVFLTSNPTGIQLECSLTYLPYNITEKMKLLFDREQGLIN